MQSMRELHRGREPTVQPLPRAAGIVGVEHPAVGVAVLAPARSSHAGPLPREAPR